jgi:hypothetical protein
MLLTQVNALSDLGDLIDLQAALVFSLRINQTQKF